jgi:hypothetical protein
MGQLVTRKWQVNSNTRSNKNRVKVLPKRTMSPNFRSMSIGKTAFAPILPAKYRKTRKNRRKQTRRRR